MQEINFTCKEFIKPDLNARYQGLFRSMTLASKCFFGMTFAK